MLLIIMSLLIPDKEGDVANKVCRNQLPHTEIEVK